MSIEEQLQELEDNMNDAKHFIDIKDSTIKLFKNREFKKVVLDYYFKEEAARLVMAKASSLNEEQQKTQNLLPVRSNNTKSFAISNT